MSALICCAALPYVTIALVSFVVKLLLSLRLRRFSCFEIALMYWSNTTWNDIGSPYGYLGARVDVRVVGALRRERDLAVLAWPFVVSTRRWIKRSHA
jgi:hypothetical protein